MKKIILLLLTIFSLNLYSQVPEPVSEQKDHIILFNGIIHDSRFGGYTQYGWVSFKDGKIDEVRKLDNQTVPAEYYDQNTILIDLDGKHVYPGLILPNSKVIHCTRNSKDICLSIFRLRYFRLRYFKLRYNSQNVIQSIILGFIFINPFIQDIHIKLCFISCYCRKFRI